MLQVLRERSVVCCIGQRNLFRLLGAISFTVRLPLPKPMLFLPQSF